MTSKILNLHRRNNSEAQINEVNKKLVPSQYYQTPQHKKMKLTKLHNFQTPIPPKPHRNLAKKPF